MLSNNNLCTGCNACSNICPNSAISMVENEEGFKYPVVNKDLCTNCGVCMNLCTRGTVSNLKQPDCYAYMASDEVRAGSSSGGVFPTLAYDFITHGGYVCGAVWADDWSVKHIVSNQLSDVERMRGSKYLQSDMGNCYKEIKSLLKKNINVLFSGTPCQVAGLRSFLNKEYDNLYCVDLICHGVPSAKVFKKYLEENFDVAGIKDCNFRNKLKAGWGTGVTINDNLIDCDYFKMFLQNVTLRRSCGDCRYAKLPRQGDITMGDFWGINNYKKDLNDELGTSVLLVNNIKGKGLLKCLQHNAKVCKKVPIKYALKGNPNLSHSTKLHKNRDLFYNQLDQLSIAQNKKIVLDDKCDCMVLNLWYSVNYGACLTAYGVICLLEKLGLNAKTINYVPWGKDSYYNNSFSEKFGYKYLNLTNPCENYSDFLGLNNSCNMFVVGSDQVWSDSIMEISHSRATKSIFLLDFVKTNNKKLSYAASIGSEEFIGSQYDKEIFNHFVKQFDDVSVRESSAKQLLENVFNKPSIQLIDGAFHIPREQLDKMTEQYASSEENYVAYFNLPYTPEVNWQKDIAYAISDKLGVPLKIMEFDKSTPVEKWLAFIKKAKFVISNSYHANVFSIIFNVPFVPVLNPKSVVNTRFDSLFKMLNIDNNFISKYDKQIDFDKVFVKRDWDKINRIIDEEVKKAEDWMRDAIALPVKDKSQYEASNFLLTKNLLDKEVFEEKFWISLNKNKILKRYLRYKILSQICFGIKRKYYESKRIKYKQYVKIIRENNLR